MQPLSLVVIRRYFTEYPDYTSIYLHRNGKDASPVPILRCLHSGGFETQIDQKTLDTLLAEGTVIPKPTPNVTGRYVSILKQKGRVKDAEGKRKKRK